MMKISVLFSVLFCFAVFASAKISRSPRVGFIFAMDIEADPFVNALELRQVSNPQGFLKSPLVPSIVYEGTHNNIEYKAVFAGFDRFSPPHQVDNVGPENAIMNTLVLLDGFEPDLIVSAGTAGGWDDKFHVNDVTVCANGQTNPYFDRRIPINSAYDGYGNGEYKCANISQSLLDANNISLARIATSASYDPSPTDEVFLNTTHVSVVDMESAAEAYISQVMDIPFLAFKVISDSYVYTNESVPVDIVCANLANKTIAVIEAIDFSEFSAINA